MSAASMKMKKSDRNLFSNIHDSISMEQLYPAFDDWSAYFNC